jgi:hypothetical protein
MLTLALCLEVSIVYSQPPSVNASEKARTSGSRPKVGSASGAKLIAKDSKASSAPSGVANPPSRSGDSASGGGDSTLRSPTESSSTLATTDSVKEVVRDQIATSDSASTEMDQLVLYAISILLVFISFVVGRHLGRRSQKVTSESDGMRMKRSHEAELVALRDELEALRGKYERTRDRLSELEDESQNERNEKLKITIVRGGVSEQQDRDAVTQGSSSRVTEYLSTPDANGEFDDSQRSSSYRMGVSVFAISHDGGGAQIAQISIADRSDATELLLRRREDMLEPVANMVNAYRTDTTAIIVETPGEIELRGGRWRVRRKMTARYV